MPNKTTKPENKEDQLQTLKTRLSVARSFDKDARKRLQTVNQVLDLKREITNGGETKTYQIKYPLAWAAYDNYLSELSSTPPQTVIEADGKEDAVKKIYWKGILENVKRRIHLVDLKEEFIQSFVEAGKAVYKVGRKVETKTVKESAKDAKGKVLVSADKEVITKNETFVEVVDPRKIYLSPETKYKSPVLGDECPYIIEEMIKSPEYIETTYGITLGEDEKEIIDPDEDQDKDSQSDAQEDKDDLKRVRLYA